MVLKINILVISIIFISIFISCTILLRPDYFTVGIFGPNMENFVEHKKTETVSLEGKEYTIVYVKNEHIDFITPTGKKDSRIAARYLVFRKLNELDEIVFNHNKKSNETIFVDKNNNNLFCIFQDFDNNRNYYVNIIDINTMQIKDTILIMNQEKYNGYINESFYDEIHNKLLFRINFRIDDLYYDGKGYFCLDINTGIVEEISETEFREITVFLHNFGSWKQGGKHFFVVDPNWDIPMEYKFKYNGTYINDGISNIRISKTMHDFNAYFAPIIWFENEQYVIYGNYLFDTSGQLNEIKIADGIVLAIF